MKHGSLTASDPGDGLRATHTCLPLTGTVIGAGARGQHPRPAPAPTSPGHPHPSRFSPLNLLLLVDHVVDEEDAVPGPVVPRELLQGHSDVHPLVGLPVAPPLQGPRLHPHGLQHRPRRQGTVTGGPPGPQLGPGMCPVPAPQGYPGLSPFATS